MFSFKLSSRKSIRLKGFDYSSEGLYFITICCFDKLHLFGKVIDGKMQLNDGGIAADKYWLEIPMHFTEVILHEYVIMPNHIHGIIEITVGANQHSPVTKNAEPLNDLGNHVLKNPNPNEIGKTNRIETKSVVSTQDNVDSKNTITNVDTRNRANVDSLNTNNGVLNNRANVDSSNTIINDDTRNRANVDSLNTNNGVLNNRANVDSPLRSPSKTIGSIVRGYKIGVTKWIRQNSDIHDVWQRNYYEHIIRDEQSYTNITEYIINNPSKWSADKFYSK